MDGQKAWYESTSIWGSMLAGVGFVLNYFFGVTVDAETQKVIINHLVNGISAFVSVLGIAGAIWGRVKADKKIAAPSA